MMHILIKQIKKKTLVWKEGEGGKGAQRGSAWQEPVPQRGSRGCGWQEKAAGSPASPLPTSPVIAPVPMTSLAAGKPGWLPRVARDPVAIG